MRCKPSQFLGKSGSPSGEQLSFDIPFVRLIPMRSSLIASAVLSLLLAACASQPAPSPSKYISQSGSLRVHPGLLGQPVPPELQPPATVATRTTAPEAAAAETAAAKPALLLQPVHFEVNSAELNASGEETVRSHARRLAGDPQLRVRLEGHADERGSSEHNLRLGQKRAEAVRAALVQMGVEAKRTSIRSLGEARPRETGHDEASWAENRRVEFVYEGERSGK